MSDHSINLEEVPYFVTKLYSMESGPLRNLFFDQSCKNHPWGEASIVYKDGKIHLRQCICKLAANKSSYYVNRSNSHGLTIYEDKRVRVWFGQKMSAIGSGYIASLLRELKIDWFPIDFIELLTTSLLQRIVKGKITNPVDFCSAWLKQNKIKASPKLTYKLFTACRATTYSQKSLGVTKKQILLYASVAENHESLIQSWDNIQHDHNIEDMIKQAQILERKINYNWSSRKMQEVHTNWTRELMELEHSNMVDVTVEYQFPLPDVPNNFKLLTTKKAVFIEGKSMNHCIYTNYWDKIERGDYMVYHITDSEGNSATLGLNVNYITKTITKNQCYSKYNRSPSDEITAQVNSWVNKELKTYNSFLQSSPMSPIPAKPFFKLVPEQGELFEIRPERQHELELLI